MDGVLQGPGQLRQEVCGDLSQRLLLVFDGDVKGNGVFGGVARGVGAEYIPAEITHLGLVLADRLGIYDVDPTRHLGRRFSPTYHKYPVFVPNQLKSITSIQR